jgi:protein-tyrosine phosphatase
MNNEDGQPTRTAPAVKAPGRSAPVATVRTSASHPLRINAGPAGGAGGEIGITFCPGKQAPSNSGFVWQRDLELDLATITAWGPVAIVTLIEDFEFNMLGVPDLGKQIQARGIEWHHLPIQDVAPPDGRFEAGWLRSGPVLLAHLRAGRRVLVHCRGGLGRAGTVAARLLVELGAAPAEAVRIVRQIRPGAIETRLQQDYVLGLTVPAPDHSKAGKPDSGIPASSDGRVDWFERLTGFQETGYAQTRQQLAVDGKQLRSRVNDQCYGIGQLELVSLAALRQRAKTGPRVAGRSSVRIVQGGVRPMHQDPAYAGAVFQVASQFNLLEMTGPSVTPEDGVTRYAQDDTQGPACAIAAGAATIFRNYFAPAGEQLGQTKELQLDGFAEFGATLARAVGRPPASLWTMRNGYSMFTPDSINLFADHLASLDAAEIDALRGLLRIGVHWDVEVTDADALPRPVVSQAFCSALPVSYNDSRGTRGARWQPLAALVLEAAFEATLWSAVNNAQRGTSNTVLLTSLGGGAFGNDKAWILEAQRWAITKVAEHGLDIVLVSYQRPTEGMRQLARDFA